MSDLPATALDIVRRNLPGATPATIAAVVDKIGADPLLLYDEVAPSVLPDVLAQAVQEIDAAAKPPANDDKEVINWLAARKIDLMAIPADRRMSVYAEALRRMKAQPTKQAPGVMRELSQKQVQSPLDRLRLANALQADHTPRDPARRLAQANSAPLLGRLQAELQRAQANRAKANTPDAIKLYDHVIVATERKIRMAGGSKP